MTAALLPAVSVLLIEDNPGDARLIREMLAEARAVRFELHAAERLSTGLALLERGGIDVVLLDLSLPDSHGLDTFERVQAPAPDLPILVLTGLDDETLAVRAVQAGAQDYLVKAHLAAHELGLSIRYAIERKRLEQERRLLERQKDELFANISHDLRTPLAAIKLTIRAALAGEPEGLSGALRKTLANIDQAADEMGRLVDDILELSRLRAGRVQLQPVPCDLRDIVRQVVQAIEPLAAAQAQTVEVDLPSHAVRARVDPERLARAVRNLVANATKYGREGGCIRASVAQKGDEVVLGIADDGPGIAEDELPRIFDRFYRSESEATRRNPGSGLGLSIARAMVELHGGRLGVQSTLGLGTTFWIALPAAGSAAPVGQ